MRRETANVLLFLLGAVLVKIALDGTALRYVKPSLLPWLVGSGAVIAVLAALAAVRDLRPTAPERSTDAGGGEESHGHGGSSAWLLTLPVLALVLVAPPALGVTSVSLSQGQAQAPAEPATDTLPERGELELGELVQRAVWDRTGSLDGRSVTVIGFVVANESGGSDLARLVINCCAADAHPVRIMLAGTVPTDAPGAWLRVTGTVAPGSATKASGFVPTLTVTASVPTPAPAEPYEY